MNRKLNQASSCNLEYWTSMPATFVVAGTGLTATLLCFIKVGRGQFFNFICYFIRKLFYFISR